MDYVKIGGRVYDVIVTGVEESFNILNSQNAGRTLAEGAPMVLDPIGTFFGHKVTLRRKPQGELEFDALYDYVSKPRYTGIPVEIVHNQTTLSYDAYVSSGSRSLTKIDKANGKVYWGELSLNIVPVKAQVLPE